MKMRCYTFTHGPSILSKASNLALWGARQSAITEPGKKPKNNISDSAGLRMLSLQVNDSSVRKMACLEDI